MSRRAVLLDTSAAFTACWLILATLGALARGFPAQEDDSDSAGPLPFIQFTKGGIRVNFGGYHAQAGLGGLLTGSKADGGLHASAGTPSGAHASAGLGGTLDGGPAGGLHARAGLGNGGPEAEAGLAGSLAGPRPQGEIVSRSSVGNLDNSILRNDKTKGKNIQVIARPKKATEVNAAADGADDDPRAKRQRKRDRQRRHRRPNNRRVPLRGSLGSMGFSRDRPIRRATLTSSTRTRAPSSMTSSIFPFQR
ncbi:uncharacterized protein LOC106637592 isoform X3 [Copidosoma floridanum]|uniref:uncharacterized protein LOC106637592 isoform X3 n=1 Tax=Copidosoma floridanum TaxID=29053 RepID=UPI0006C9A273|nr:uncharacterized protein LOC106637592 isoform X3 [Copidosoma floridanum]